jgi:hypothetical protein
MPGDEKLRAPPAVQQFFQTLKATMQGSCGDFHAYPVVRLTSQNALANKLESVAMKSIYQFFWQGTGYVVQFTVNRRWQSILKMSQEDPVDTDFDLTTYAENWDQDSRVPAGETVGKIWRKDLQGLLRDEASDATGSALSRVQGLIKTIQDIRDVFEDVSRSDG